MPGWVGLTSFQALEDAARVPASRPGYGEAKYSGNGLKIRSAGRSDGLQAADGLAVNLSAEPRDSSFRRLPSCRRTAQGCFYSQLSVDFLFAIPKSQPLTMLVLASSVNDIW